MLIHSEPKIPLDMLVLTSDEKRLLKHFCEYSTISIADLQNEDITCLEKYGLIKRDGLLDKKGYCVCDENGNCLFDNSYTITDLGKRFYLRQTSQRKTFILEILSKLISFFK